MHRHTAAATRIDSEHLHERPERYKGLCHQSSGPWIVGRNQVLADLSPSRLTALYLALCHSALSSFFLRQYRRYHTNSGSSLYLSVVQSSRAVVELCINTCTNLKAVFSGTWLPESSPIFQLAATRLPLPPTPLLEGIPNQQQHMLLSHNRYMPPAVRCCRGTFDKR